MSRLGVDRPKEYRGQHECTQGHRARDKEKDDTNDLTDRYDLHEPSRITVMGKKSGPPHTCEFSNAGGTDIKGHKEATNPTSHRGQRNLHWAIFWRLLLNQQSECREVSEQSREPTELSSETRPGRRRSGKGDAVLFPDMPPSLIIATTGLGKLKHFCGKFLVERSSASTWKVQLLLQKGRRLQKPATHILLLATPMCEYRILAMELWPSKPSKPSTPNNADAPLTK
jgi:hypothetical protein